MSTNANAVNDLMAYKPPAKKLKKKDPGLSNAMAADMVAVGGAESVNVCIRCRPFNRRELELHSKNNPDEFIRSVIEMPEGVQGKLKLLDRNATTGDYTELEDFSFSRTFWSVAAEQQPHKYLPIQQEDVFDSVGRVVLTNALGGFNSCIFAYGQTGSGKTHSMMGDFRAENGEFQGDPGLIPRMCRELFRLVAEKKEMLEAENDRLKVEFDVKLSALEIYNEQVKDLFWKNSAVQGRKKDTILKIRTHPTQGAFVDQLTWLNPKNWEQCIKAIATGVGERTVAATLMNPESSRSHSVFQIIVERTESLGPPANEPARKFEKPVVTTKSSRINLVDLAGSERNKKSGAQGQQLKEAAGINQSLSTLKKVIDTLVDNSKIANPKRQVLVPYRESALTQLLSHSLGGNSKTTMIACVSPHYDNLEETLFTLRYAARAKGIVNNVKANEDNAQKQAMLLREQIMALQERLQSAKDDDNDQKSMDELKDQIEVGQRAMSEMRAAQDRKDQEAAKAADVLKSQKDARYAAMYYNSFKRVFLQRQRDLSETQLYLLEKKLADAQREKEQLSSTIAHKDRGNRDTKYTMEEYKRRDELWQLKSARNEASARQLVRDIAKSKKRVEENLTTRFGLVWVKAREERVSNASLMEQSDALRKDHEQYLSSIVREAKKQYDALTDRYTDRQDAMKTRLETVERGRLHAASQSDKAQQLELSLRSNLEKMAADHERRELDKVSSWEKRYNDMKTMYEEKLDEIRAHHNSSIKASKEELTSIHRNAEKKSHDDEAAQIRKLKQVDIDGERRVAEVKSENQQRIDQMVAQSELERQDMEASLIAQFEEDSTSLTKQNEVLRDANRKARLKLEELYRFALQLEDDSKHIASALKTHVPPANPATDYVLFRREMEEFGRVYAQHRIEFHRVSTVLRKTI